MGDLSKLSGQFSNVFSAVNDTAAKGIKAGTQAIKEASKAAEANTVKQDSTVSTQKKDSFDKKPAAVGKADSNVSLATHDDWSKARNSNNKLGYKGSDTSTQALPKKVLSEVISKSKLEGKEKANLMNFLNDIYKDGKMKQLGEGIRDHDISKEQIDLIGKGEFTAQDYSKWVSAGNPGG